MAAPTHPAARGFYVFQAAIGTPLQFHPALGTSELDALMDAYLPCPGTMQEKRASISVDFFDHFRLTGESIKFYQVPDWVNSTTSSPNSTQDSGYGSSFTTSPLVPTWSWGPLESATASTPSTASSVSTPQIPSRRRRQSSAKQSVSSRAGAADFSTLPGMKILTRDGRDVTNAASRGCKTKEQRDHAHLMRIMKACESCKKKKVRCDPSHRTRPSPVSPAEQPARSAKKPRISNPQHKPVVTAPSFDPAIPGDPSALPALSENSFEMENFDFLNETPIDEQASWDEFLRFNGELDSTFADGLGDLPDLQPTLPSAPSRLPVPSPDPHNAPIAFVQPGDIAVQDIPKLPYLKEYDVPHTYVDFNLYSPTSSFSDSELSVSTDLPVGSLSKSEATKRQPSDPGVNEQLATSTIHRREGYPDTSVPDHSQGSCSPELQTWPSVNSAPALLEAASDHATQSVSASGSSDLEGLFSRDFGWTQPSMNDAQVLRDANLWSRDSRASRTTYGSMASNQVHVVSSVESPASDPDSTLSRSIVTTRQSSPITVAATQAAAAELQSSGWDVAHQVISGEDERGSGLVISRHPAMAKEHASRHADSTSASSTAPASLEAATLSEEQPRSANRLASASVHDCTTLRSQTAPIEMLVSSLETTASTVAPVGADASRAPLLSRRPPTGTDCFTGTEEVSRTRATAVSPSDLMSVATTVVSAVTSALTCMAASPLCKEVVLGASDNAMWPALCAMADCLSRQSLKTDDLLSSTRSPRTRRTVSRIDTGLSRIPVTV